MAVSGLCRGRNHTRACSALTLLVTRLRTIASLNRKISRQFVKPGCGILSTIRVLRLSFSPPSIPGRTNCRWLWTARLCSLQTGQMLISALSCCCCHSATIAAAATLLRALLFFLQVKMMTLPWVCHIRGASKRSHCNSNYAELTH